MVSTKIGVEEIKRESGYLIYVGKDGHVWASPMKHNKTGTKKKLSTQSIEKKPGFMYYLGKDGYVYQAVLNNKGRPKGS